MNKMSIRLKFTREKPRLIYHQQITKFIKICDSYQIQEALKTHPEYSNPRFVYLANKWINRVRNNRIKNNLV